MPTSRTDFNRSETAANVLTFGAVAHVIELTVGFVRLHAVVGTYPACASSITIHTHSFLKLVVKLHSGKAVRVIHWP